MWLTTRDTHIHTHRYTLHTLKYTCRHTKVRWFIYVPTHTHTQTCKWVTHIGINKWVHTEFIDDCCDKGTQTHTDTQTQADYFSRTTPWRQTDPSDAFILKSEPTLKVLKLIVVPRLSAVSLNRFSGRTFLSSASCHRFRNCFKLLLIKNAPTSWLLFHNKSFLNNK